MVYAVELVCGWPEAGRPRNPPQRAVGWHFSLFVRVEELREARRLRPLPGLVEGRRRLLFCFKEKLYTVDTETKKVTEIMRAALSARTGEMLGAASISPDQRTLYFSQGTIEADVWMLKAQ